MRIKSLPKFLLALFAFFLGGMVSNAQTINFVPEPAPQYNYQYSGGISSATWGYSGNPIVYNNQLYVQYQSVAFDLASNGEGPFQLALDSANTLKLIANPDTGYVNGVRGGGYVFGSAPVVYNNEICIQYLNKNGVKQLATYNGTSLTLIPNPDASPYGYIGSHPFIYNNMLYFPYRENSNLVQLARFDGTTVTLIPNPDASPYGYQGNPIVFNGKLFVKYAVNNQNGTWHLAQFDGTTWTVLANPDASPYGYQGNPVIYNNNLYMQYATASNVLELMVYDGTNAPSLIANPDNSGNGQGYEGFPIVYNNNLYIQYQNVSGILQLAKFDGTSVSLIPNPDASTNGYQGTPIVFNNTLCIFYRNAANVNQLAVYNSGDSLHLVSNADASTNGYWNFPIVYGTNLYFQYYNAAGVFQLGYYDGASLKLIPNPPGGFGNATSYYGYPFVFNNLLYMQYYQAQYNGFSNLASFNQSALPVTFINFDGVLRNDNAYLTWGTATEINNKGFEVEKSMDGQSFTKIGFVNGHGNSSNVNNYNYTDVKVVSGSNYYRLKQVDLDGNFNYSAVIKLDYARFGWAILGNPVGNNSWIQLKLEKSSKVALQVISMNGSILQTLDKETMSAGTYSIPLNLGRASAGMYIVRLIVDNNIYSKKISK